MMTQLEIEHDVSALSPELASQFGERSRVARDRALVPKAAGDAVRALGMADTGFKVPADKQHRLTDCYMFDPQTKMKPFDSGDKSRWAKDRSFHSGGGGLVSTLADYHRFCLMLLGGGALDGTRIVSRKTLDLMTANHLVGGGDLVQHSVGIFSEAENAGVGFGLGFGLIPINPATLVDLPKIQRQEMLSLHQEEVGAFLDSAGVPIETSSGGRDLSVADIGEKARAFSVLIDCKR